MPQPKFVLIDAMFELRSSCMAWIVVYVGLSSIGGIVGFSKLLTSLSMDVAAMVAGEELINNLQS